jgi:hypothetical protein
MRTPWTTMNPRVCAGSSLVAAALDDDESDEPVSDEFATSSTQPVGTSFQTVPSPSSPESTDGVQIRQPVPAMLATSLSIDSSNANSSEGEMRGCMALYLLGWIVGARRVG